MTLLFMDNNWEFNGQEPIKLRKKSKLKNKNKTILEINKKRKNKRFYALASKKWMKSLTYSLKRQISFLTKRWESNCKKPVNKKNSRKNWNYWKKHYQLIQSLNSTFSLTKWLILVNTSVKNKNILFYKKKLENNNKQKSKNKEQWKKIKEEIKKRKKYKK